MRLLIDTHALIWYVDQDQLLSPAAHAEITDPNNDLLLSAGSLWEIAIKVGLGKLSLSMPYRHWIAKAVADLSLSIVPITIEYVDVLTTLPKYHGDPFDRLIIAQAMVEQIAVVSGDSNFDAYTVTRKW